MHNTEKSGGNNEKVQHRLAALRRQLKAVDSDAPEASKREEPLSAVVIGAAICDIQASPLTSAKPEPAQLIMRESLLPGCPFPTWSETRDQLTAVIISDTITNFQRRN